MVPHMVKGPNIEPLVRGVFETVEGSRVERPKMRRYDVERVGL